MTKILLMGDSIARGYNASILGKSWFPLFCRQLETATGLAISPTNHSSGGRCMTPRCPAYGASTKPAVLESAPALFGEEWDLIILACGHNDYRGGISPEVFRSEYDALLSAASQSGRMVMVSSLYNTLDKGYKHMPDFCRNTLPVEEFNTVLSELATKYGAAYADVYTPFLAAPHLIDPDGLHPTDQGHLLLASVYLQTALTYFPDLAGKLPRESLVYAFRERYGNQTF
ncbi:MAG: SGNH/GDSL hydrolase family protein [Ruminococcaceae bacterium]|nr:SGNH/GDSL hydrolase family protein [Oscillospiraceae bacterium]